MATVNGNCVVHVHEEDSENYTYDYLSRIASSAGPWGSTSYSYDGAGNMVNYTLNGVTSYYNIGPSNELLQAGSTLMAYDLDGNIIGKSAGAPSWGYSYDFEDRLVNASLNGQPVQSNLYDGSGNRVTATVGGSSMLYMYDGINILYEKNLTSGAVTDHFYLGRLQLAKLSSSTPYYYHFDALGSTRLVTTTAAISVFSTNYLPYGIGYGASGSETFMYNDKPVDSSTGLYYFGARFYDPSVFRFVTRDRYAGSLGDPLSLNLYAFARDNPMAMVDVDGHMPTSATLAFVAGGIISAIVGCLLTQFWFWPYAFNAMMALSSMWAYLLIAGEQATAWFALGFFIFGWIAPNMNIIDDSIQISFNAFVDALEAGNVALNPFLSLVARAFLFETGIGLTEGATELVLTSNEHSTQSSCGPDPSDKVPGGHI